MAVACGGPSESYIESALNKQLASVRTMLIATGTKIDSCPDTKDGLAALNISKRETCFVLNSSFADVDIEKCIEKGTAYSCKISMTIASKFYGDTVSTLEGMFEETAGGWKEVK